MPKRRLPYSNNGRLSALKKAQKALQASEGDWIIPDELGFKVLTMAKNFEEAMDLVGTLRSRRLNALRHKRDVLQKANLTANHFLQSFFNAIAREKFQATETSHFGLDSNATEHVVAANEFETTRWMHLIEKGERARVDENLSPVEGPRLAELLDVKDDFEEADKQAFLTTREYHVTQRALVDKIDEIDLLIVKLWNQLELSMIGLSKASRRARLREFGVVYINVKQKATDGNDDTEGADDAESGSMLTEPRSSATATYDDAANGALGTRVVDASPDGRGDPEAEEQSTVSALGGQPVPSDQLPGMAPDAPPMEPDEESNITSESSSNDEEDVS